MTDVLAPSKLRPGLKTVLHSTTLGLFAALVQFGLNGTSGPLMPWQVGALLTVLALWFWGAMEGSIVAHHRRGKSWITLAALSYAYGYFMAVCLVLMQLGADTLVNGWMIYSIAGMVFGVLMGLRVDRLDGPGRNHYFDADHALERNMVSRGLYLAWPILTVLIITLLVLMPPATAFPPNVIAVLMVLFAAIWPLPYDIAKPYRKMFVGHMLLGLMLLMAVLATG